MRPAPLVVKLGGALLDDAAQFPQVFDALARMQLDKSLLSLRAP